MLSLRAWWAVLRLLVKHRGNAHAVREEAVTRAALLRLRLVGGAEMAAMWQSLREAKRQCSP